MVKRSPWTRLSIVKKEHRVLANNIRREFSVLPLGLKRERMIKLVDGVKNGLSLEEQLAFLREHKSEVGPAIHELTTQLSESRDSSRVRKFMVNAILNGSAPAEVIPIVTNEVAKRVFLGKKEDFPKKVFNHLKEFLIARRIPVNDSVLNRTISVLGESFVEDIVIRGKVDSRLLEKTYLSELKSERRMTLQARQFLNIIVSNAFRGLRLTAKQRRTAKRWLIQNEAKYWNRFQEDLLRGNNSGVDFERTQAKIVSEMTLDLKKNLEKSFFQTKKPTKSFPMNKAGAITSSKAGNRAQRIANYSAREKINKRSEKLVNIREAVIRTGQKFNTREYCLNEIVRENPVNGGGIRLLAQQGLLKDAVITKLFTSGSLTQKTFILAIDSGFLREFKENEINSLASFLSFIGPVGVKIPELKKSVGAGLSSRLFKFLHKKGLIEIHSHGATVYLKRN